MSSVIEDFGYNLSLLDMSSGSKIDKIIKEIKDQINSEIEYGEIFKDLDYEAKMMFYKAMIRSLDEIKNIIHSDNMITYNFNDKVKYSEKYTDNFTTKFRNPDKLVSEPAETSSSTIHPDNKKIKFDFHSFE